MSPPKQNLYTIIIPVCTYIDKSTSAIYILLDKRLSSLFKTEEEYEVIESFKGKELFGKKYIPLFPYFQHVSFHGYTACTFAHVCMYVWL